MEEFAGKTAVVTGAGSGMGKAFALRWGAEGMNVVIGDIQQDALDATVAELTAAGVPVLGLRTDVSKRSDIEALADAAESRFGPIHLVNNNAGVEGYLDGPIWEATSKDWDWTLSVNLMSVIYGVQDVRAADARARRAGARRQHLLDDFGDRGGRTCTGSASTRSWR